MRMGGAAVTDSTVRQACGSKRVDQGSMRSWTPESLAPRAQITTEEGLVLTMGTGKAFTVPDLGKWSRFGRARVGTLLSVLESGCEPFVDSHKDCEMHRDITRLTIARYWCILQTETVLLHERQLDYGVV